MTDQPAPPDAAPDDSEISVRLKVLEDARKIRRAARLLSHGTIGVVLALHLVATGIVSWVVLTEPFPYPVMYVLNGLLLFLVLAIRFTALLNGRTISAALWLAANLVLHGFWVWVLADQVPGRPIITGRVVARLDQPVLWVSIVLYVLAMAGMLGHAVVHAWHLRRQRAVQEAHEALPPGP